MRIRLAGSSTTASGSPGTVTVSSRGAAPGAVTTTGQVPAGKVVKRHGGLQRIRCGRSR